jgi:hypothetical protein
MPGSGTSVKWKRFRREARAIRADMRRAFSMGVREARNARGRRQELDVKITQLAAAQLVTEEKLQRLIDSRVPAGTGTRGNNRTARRSRSPPREQATALRFQPRFKPKQEITK